jgi:uncharacterized protein (TIGR02001 family)
MKTKILIAVMAAMIGFAPVANAEDLISEKDIGGKFSANAALTTEYFFRGLTQSGKGNPAIQGGFDFAHNSGVYLGTWASSINFGGNVETDFYGGWSGEVGSAKLGLDIGVIYYHYPSSASSGNLDFVEGYVGLSKDFGAAAVSAKVSYSPDYTVSSGDATYLEAGLDIPLGKYFTLNGHIGHQWVDQNTAFGFDDYTDYSVGVGFGLFGFAGQVAWIGTDLASSQVADDGRLMASLSRSF